MDSRAAAADGSTRRCHSQRPTGVPQSPARRPRLRRRTQTDHAAHPAGGDPAPEPGRRLLDRRGRPRCGGTGTPAQLARACTHRRRARRRRRVTRRRPPRHPAWRAVADCTIERGPDAVLTPSAATRPATQRDGDGHAARPATARPSSSSGSVPTPDPLSDSG